MERSKVYKGLNCCKEFLCGECPYKGFDHEIYKMRCIHMLIADLAELSKELSNSFDIVETIKDGKSHRMFSCCNTECTNMTSWIMPTYCPWCGKKIGTILREWNKE